MFLNVRLYMCVYACVCAYMRACVWILDDVCHFIFTDLQVESILVSFKLENSRPIATIVI